MTGRMDPYTIWRHHKSRSRVYGKNPAPRKILVKPSARLPKRHLLQPVFKKVKLEWLSQPEAFQKILSDREQEVLRRVVTGWTMNVSANN